MKACCGFSVEKGTKIIAILQLVSVLVLLGGGIAAFALADDKGRSDLSTFGVRLGFVVGTGLLMSYILYTGVTKRSVVRLNICLVASFIGIIVGVVSSIFNLIESFNIVVLLLTIAQFGVQVWFMCIILDFRKQLMEAKLPIAVRRDDN